MNYALGMTLFCVMALLASMYYFKCSVFEMVIILGICGAVLYVVTTMSFTDTYILELLRRQGTGDIFEDTNGFVVTVGNKYKDHVTTYGEVHAKGIENVFEYTKTTYPDTYDTFIDLGCGVGKSVVAAKLVGFEHVVGVEVVKARYEQALSAKKKLPEHLQTNMTFVQADAQLYEFESYDKPLVIFMSNLLWRKKTNQDMFHIIGERCPSGTLVVCSAYDFYPKDEPLFKKETIINMPMSWDARAYCWVFKKI